MTVTIFGLQLTARDLIDLLALVGIIWRGGVRYGKTRAELRWQSSTLLQMARKSGTSPPPRDRLMTLDDPWDEIEIEAHSLKKGDRR